MANSKKRNSIYVDATGDITVDAVVPVLMGVLMTPSAANSVFVLKETSSSGTIKVSMKIEGVESRYVDFSGFGGIELTTTFNISTLTNITAVILYGTWTNPAGKAQ